MFWLYIAMGINAVWGKLCIYGYVCGQVHDYAIVQVFS